jgi:hypothetical protein
MAFSSQSRHHDRGQHLADIERLDAELVTVKQRITTAVTACATTLTELHGVGPVTAAVISVRFATSVASGPAPSSPTTTARTDRGIQRGSQSTPVEHARQPRLEPCDPHDRRHPSRPRHARARLLPPQTSRGQDPQRSNARTQAPSVRRRLATTPTRPLTNRWARGDRQGRLSIQRGRLEP